MRLLHITGGAVAVAGGIILAILAINMVAGPAESASVGRNLQKHANPLVLLAKAKQLSLPDEPEGPDGER